MGGGNKGWVPREGYGRSKAEDHGLDRANRSGTGGRMLRRPSGQARGLVDLGWGTRLVNP